jgi:hypothetical protein
MWRTIFGITPGEIKKAAKPTASGSEGNRAPDAQLECLEAEGTEGYLFSRLYCGSDHTGYVRTDKYWMNGDKPGLANIMAISGAAVSPFQMRSLLTRMVMLVLNIRLGQWLPHPRHLPRPPTTLDDKESDRTLKPDNRSWMRRLGASSWGAVSHAVNHVLNQPTYLGLAWSSWFRDSGNQVYSFISDGGHHENLGLWPLLQRRCFLIIVSDAAQDNQHTFEDFLRLCRRIRLLEGIEFVELNPDEQTGKDVPLQLYSLRLPPDAAGGSPLYLPSMADRFCHRHYVIARIKYPKKKHSTGPEEGYLVYVKASLTGDEETDLLGFCRENKAFPHDPTAHPMFDEDQVESYRQLGYHIGEKMCLDIRADPEDPLWNYKEFKIEGLVDDWLLHSSLARHVGENARGDADMARLLGLGPRLPHLDRTVATPPDPG